MYAILTTGGKQYRVEEGDVLFVEKLDVEADAAVVFDKILAVTERISITLHTAITLSAD